MAFWKLFGKRENKKDTKPSNNQQTQESTRLIRVSTLFEKYAASANTDEVYGDKIPSLITSYKRLYFDKAPQNEVNEAFSNLMNEVFRTVFIVPIRYDSDSDEGDDRGIHFTRRAANKLSLDAIACRGRHMSKEQMENLVWVVEYGQLTPDFDWWDISRISGSDGCHFVLSNAPRTMYPVVGENSDGITFLAFCGLEQFREAYGQRKGIHIGLFHIDDIIDYLYETERGFGLVINPDTETHCFSNRRVFIPPKNS